MLLPLAKSMAGKPSRGGNRCRSLQTQLLDALFAHDELLDLAGDRRGKSLNELDVARDFLMGDFITTILAQLFGADCLPLAQSHPGHNLLAVLRIRHADHLHIADLRMGIEKLLDLTGV